LLGGKEKASQLLLPSS